jgi:hypothetical protein
MQGWSSPPTVPGAGQRSEQIEMLQLQDAASQQLELDYYVTAHTYSEDGTWRGNRTAKWVSPLQDTPTQKKTSPENWIVSTHICCNSSVPPIHENCLLRMCNHIVV